MKLSWLFIFNYELKFINIVYFFFQQIGVFGYWFFFFFVYMYIYVCSHILSSIKTIKVVKMTTKIRYVIQ